MKNAAAVLVLAVLCVAPSRSVADPSTYETVLKMMSKVPEKAHPSRPGRYDQTGDAKAIARGIAAATDDLDDVSLAVVFAAYESSNSLHGPTGECIGGDPDKATLEYQSWGPFQLNVRVASKEAACDPQMAAATWLDLMHAARKLCASSPPEDRLAALASGSCTNRGGIKESRLRTRVAEQVLEAASP